MLLLFSAPQGYLIPKYHRSYWLGARASSVKSFAWLDPTVLGLNYSSSYKHWGLDESDSSFEPNNRLGSELCSVGNWSQTYGVPQAWGWSDTKCNMQFPTMCRLLRECARSYILFSSGMTGTAAWEQRQ